MFLIIDNSDEKGVAFYFSEKGDFDYKKFKEDNQSLLICLEKFLKQSKRKLSDIKYLGVVVGEGKFTATRLAVTAANTLAYALQIPVMGLPKGWIPETVWQQIKKIPVGRYAVPKYSGEAHIGKKKSV